MEDCQNEIKDLTLEIKNEVEFKFINDKNREIIQTLASLSWF